MFLSGGTLSPVNRPKVNMPEKQSRLPAKSGRQAHGILLVGLLCAALSYLDTLWFGFVYDDHQITRLTFASWRTMPHLFTQHLWAGVATHSNYYRPVLASWAMILSTLAGTSTVLWHMVAVALHLLVTVVLFYLVAELSHDQRLAAMAAAIFAVHPVHTEVVAWASGSASEASLGFLFIFAFYAYVRSRRSPEEAPVWRIIALLFTAAAMFTKETAIVLPVLILAYEVLLGPRLPGETGLFHGKTLRRIASNSLPFFLLAGCYLFIRSRVLHSDVLNASAISTAAVSSRFLSIPEALWFYVSHLLWPFHLSLFYSLYLVTVPSLANFWLPLFGVLVATGLLVWIALYSRLGAIASVIIALTLTVPILGMYALPSWELVHDRYLYLPSAGFALLVALGIRWIMQKMPGRLTGVQALSPLILLVGIYSFTTLSQTIYWTDDLSLYSRSVNIAPDNVSALCLLANEEFSRRQRPDLALELYAKALRIDPEDWKANFAMGVTEFDLAQYPAAEQHFQAATRIDASSSIGFAFLGKTRLALGDFAGAAQTFRQQISSDPANPMGHYLLGMALLNQGQRDDARRELQQSLTLDPASPARQTLAQTF
jgi:tetratricopeptide (TPR) repeat protein